MRSRLLTRDTIAAILIALAPFLYFLPGTLGRIVLAADDALIFGMPLRMLAAQMLREGHLPLWNPYIFCGMPLFASAQGGVLFPLNWAFLVTSANSAMNFAVLASYAGAGVGAFLYARRIGTNVFGATITAFAWQFGGVAVGQVTHTNILHVYAVLPWIFWSIEGYVASPTARRAALVSGLVALQVFAGHQQTLAYSLVLAGAYIIAQASAQNETRWRTWLLAGVFLAVGVLLAAIQILPTAELLRASMRDKATYDFFSSYSLPPVFFLTWFAPYVLGGGDGTVFRAPYIGEPFYPEYIGYIGLAPLMLAAVAPFVRRDRLTLFWTAAALVALPLAIARFLPLELYRLVYHIPILNLFRVPARHLMEVDFALAVLAGRAVTFLPEVEGRRRILLTVAASAVVLVLTCGAVTWWRPAEFQLARVAPVSVMRAPELFMPMVVAALSGSALLRFAQARRRSAALLLAMVVCDLALWGQFSGWRTGSPRRKQDVFKTPAFVKEMRGEMATDGPFRVLTVDRPLADALANRPPTPGIDINLQPDTCMVHRIENAAGYDGFGVKRYSQLAGDMKVWGEFPDARRSLLVSRELDLLNVRYVVSAAPGSDAPQQLPANTRLGDFQFFERDLGIPYLESGKRLEFDFPPIETTRVALVTNLAWSTNLPDGAVAGTVTLRASDGRSFRFELHVGVDTSEWAYDRPAVRSAIRHSRAPVATSSPAEAPEGNFDAHSFVTSFALPQKAAIVGGTIEVPSIISAPQFSLCVQRVSLVDESRDLTVPLRAEWITKDGSVPVSERWRETKRVGNIVLHRNANALPRVWLATDARVVPEEEQLEMIRTAKFPDGEAWDAARTVLLEESLSLASASQGAGEARITRYEPNTVEISARVLTPSILVLADNHFPGWRVTVDGKNDRLLRVDYNLRGVQLAPGEHNVRFTYFPMSLVAGAIVSAITAAALGAWSWRSR